MLGSPGYVLERGLQRNWAPGQLGDSLGTWDLQTPGPSEPGARMSCWEEQPRGPGVRAGVGPAGPRAGPGSAPWPPVLCGFSLGRNWVWSVVTCCCPLCFPLKMLFLNNGAPLSVPTAKSPFEGFLRLCWPAASAWGSVTPWDRRRSLGAGFPGGFKPRLERDRAPELWAGRAG